MWTTTVMCSWCHTSVIVFADGTRCTCPSCGHDAGRARMECECPTCRPARREAGDRDDR